MATGFLGGGKLLDFWVDLDVIDASTLTITPKDPRWVGAWWIGFILSGCIAFTLAALIGAFPQELPKQKEIQKVRRGKVEEEKKKRKKKKNNGENERQTERQTERQKERQAERQTDTDRKSDIQKGRVRKALFL